MPAVEAVAGTPHLLDQLEIQPAAGGEVATEVLMIQHPVRQKQALMDLVVVAVRVVVRRLQILNPGVPVLS